MAAIGAVGIGAAGAGPGILAFRMEVEGFEVVKVNLQRFGERIKDFRPFWREYFAPAFYASMERHFDTEGAYVGGWAPLSARYAAWKARRYPGKTILRRTEALFRSLSWSSAAEEPGRDGVFIAEPSSLIVGTRVAYAGYHQRGTTRMPARQLLFTLGRQTGSSMGRLLHRFATDVFKDEGYAVASRRAAPVGSGLL